MCVKFSQTNSSSDLGDSPSTDWRAKVFQPSSSKLAGEKLMILFGKTSSSVAVTSMTCKYVDKSDICGQKRPE